MAQIERKYYFDHIKFLVENKIQHTITFSGRSRKVKSGIGKSEFVNAQFSLKALGFIRRVRAHILNNKTYENVGKGEYRRLMLINMKGMNGKDMVTGAVEFDLNKAYWIGALKAGVISQDIYDEGIGKGLSKIELLATIGTMAKTVKQRYFDGENYGRSLVLTDSGLTRHIWNAVSWEVDKCMQDIASSLGSVGFLFYWTDAVFFKDSSRNREIVAHVAEKHGFSGKFIGLEYISGKGGHTVAWTKGMKGHAQEDNVLRDTAGNYGRVFVYVDARGSMMKEIMEGERNATR